MKHLKIVTTIVGCASLLLFAVLLYSAKDESRRTSARLKETLLALTNAQSTVKTKEQTAELLESKVNQLVQVLTNSTEQLRTAQETIRGYQLAEDENRKTEEPSKRMLAEIAPPRIAVEKDFYGKDVKTFRFPNVLDVNGRVLASEAKFGQLTGRRLSFYPAVGGISVDVDQVHPAILHYLDINPETAKQSQARIDNAWRIYQAAGYQQVLADQKARQERWEAQERIRIEQEKANAEIAAQQAQQRAIQETAYNERLKSADAAMIQALGGRDQVIIQTINRNSMSP